MNKMKSLMGVAIALSLALTANPAMAQPRGQGWGQGQGWGGPVRCEDLNSRRQREECFNRHRPNNNNNDADAIGAAIGVGIIGLTLGAIIAGAANDREKQQRIGEYDRWVSYCSNKYRSFDIRTGTFLGNDGRRHVCQ